MSNRRGTILVVDDEVDVLEMIEVGLGLDGYQVILADSGEKAVEVIASQPIDLVISDLRMPGMNGLETIARLRELAPALPVIVVTGYLAPGAVQDCMALGRVNLLRKPFRFKNLTHAVQSVLGRPPPPPARG